MRNLNKKYFPILLLVALLVFFQIFSSLMGKSFYLTQLTMAAYYSLVVIGLSVLMGYTGQISLGHAAFFAMGGYTTAVISTKNLLLFPNSPVAKFFISSGLTSSLKDPYGNNLVYVSPWISLFLAIVIVALVAFLIGIPILKLKGHYLAMATLGFGSIVYSLFLGSSIFGEADGISDVPPFNIFPGVSVNGDPSSRVLNYYIAWVVVIVAVVLLLNLINSRVGRGLRAIHGSEEAAGSMGINTLRYKLMIFVLSAVFSAIGGVFLTHFTGGIAPPEAHLVKSVRYVAIVAVGGMSNLWGALFMGVILNYISLRGYLGSYDDAFFGLILILVMLFAPDGLLKKENYHGFIAFVKRIKKYFQKEDVAI